MTRDRDLAKKLLPYQIVFAVTSAAVGGIVAILGELRDEFGFSGSEVGLIVTAGFLASFVSQIVLSPLADRGYGRRMAVAGMALSAVSLLVMAIATSVLVWTLSRAALGFAGGLLLPGIRRAATVMDPERAGESLGKLIVGEILGFTLGPVVAAVLFEVGGLRLPFLAAGVGMALFVPFVLRLPEDTGRRTQQVRNPFELLRLPRLQGALTLIFGYFFLIGAFEAVIPVMFQDRGGSALETGLAFSLFGIPIALASTHAGRISDRLGPDKVAIAGMAISSAVAMSYGFVPGIWLVIAIMMIAGVSDGYGFTAGQVAVSRSVPEERQAGALGLMGAAEVLGAGVAALPAAAVYDAYGARVVWVATGFAALVVLSIGWLRLRSSGPLHDSGLDVEWTPVDRHPTPDV